MTELYDSNIAKHLLAYGVPTDPDLCGQIRTYVSLLHAWNSKISLTTVKDPIEILVRHFGECFFASSLVPMRVGRLADVGSGAGFPGIPIRMLNPNLDVTLIESNTKRCAFLSEVVRKLGLDHVAVVRSRVEDLHDGIGTFDFVTSRAVGGHAGILSWAKKMLSSFGKVLLWLGGEDARHLVLQTGWVWQEPVLIPGSKNRFIVVGSPKP